MARKMSNLKIIIFTILISLILLVGATFIDIYKTHKNRLILVSQKRITEACETCFLEEKCHSSKVTLQELIDLNYLKEEVNPLTKMYYSKESYVTKENDTYVFHEVD